MTGDLLCMSKLAGVLDVVSERESVFSVAKSLHETIIYLCEWVCVSLSLSLTLFSSLVNPVLSL